MRVLFVVKEYLPKPTPPGVCIMNVQKALFEKGIQSDVLMVGEEEGLYYSSEIGDVYSIKSGISFEKRKERVFDYLKTRISMIITWPVPSMKRVKDYRRMIAWLNRQKNYNAIIGTMFPPDVCVACSAFEHFFYYELDSLINNPMYKEGIKKYLTYRLRRLEKVLFDKAELIIHLNHNKKFYNKERYDKYRSKFIYTDIPNLAKSEIISNNNYFEETSNKILMVYSGHLSKEYRSPTCLIELLKTLSTKINMECLFFSRGDCEDELRKAEKDTNGIIKRMGYVSQEELDHYICRADFLLDIGNNLTGEDCSLPSKVISYIATGKPIIHMNGTNDSAIEYLEKYGLGIMVDNFCSIEKQQQQVIKFINENIGKSLSFKIVENRFQQNTPQFTANIIIKAIEKQKLNY